MELAGSREGCACTTAVSYHGQAPGTSLCQMCAQALSVTLDVHREETVSGQTPRCFSSCGKPCSSGLSLNSPVVLLLKDLLLTPPESPIR